MSTFRELVYMILDELKVSTDDAYYTEDHIIYLLNKYRALVLKQKYSDIKKQIPESNYQTICLELIKVPKIPGMSCCNDFYLRSKDKIPFLIQIGSPRVYTVDYYQGEITHVSMERMRYIGYNKYLKNIIYSSIGPDNYLYLKSNNPQFLYLSRINMTGVFEDSVRASELECPNCSSCCDVLDKTFPLESALIPNVIDMIVKELLGSVYKPEDDMNNAKDDLSDLASFIARNAKSNLQKQIES